MHNVPITFNVVIMRIHVLRGSITQYLHYLKNQQPCKHDKYESNMENLHTLRTHFVARYVQHIDERFLNLYIQSVPDFA